MTFKNTLTVIWPVTAVQKGVNSGIQKVTKILLLHNQLRKVAWEAKFRLITGCLKYLLFPEYFIPKILNSIGLFFCSASVPANFQFLPEPRNLACETTDTVYTALLKCSSGGHRGFRCCMNVMEAVWSIMAAALIQVVLFVAFFQDYIFMFSEVKK